MRYQIAMVGILGLTACNPTPAELAQQPYQRQFTLSENYQAVYARTLGKMRQCMGDGTPLPGGMASLQVEGQLYSELGYGEIESYIAHVSPIAGTNVRIDRSGEGAMVSLKAREDAPVRVLDWLEYYARGGETCQVFAEAPPPLVTR